MENLCIHLLQRKLLKGSVAWLWRVITEWLAGAVMDAEGLTQKIKRPIYQPKRAAYRHKFPNSSV